MDKTERSASPDLMPPPPNVPNAKNSSQKTLQSTPPKNKKPRQDTPIKKTKNSRMTLQQLKDKFLPPIAENQEQVREELSRGVTYEEFIKWGDLDRKEDLRQFCEKALNKDELDKLVEALDALISKNEKKASDQNVRAILQENSFLRTCRAKENKERSLSRLTSQLCEIEEAVDAFEDIQQFLVQSDVSAKILIDTVKRSVKVEAERVEKIRANGLKAMQTTMLEDYLSYEKIRRGIPLTKKTMNRNETIVWLIEKSREPKDTANKENGEKERVEEQEDENRNAEFPSTEKSDQLMSLPSLESIPSSADHKLSQFSDVSDTTTNVKEGPSASDANRQ